MQPIGRTRLNPLFATSVVALLLVGTGCTGRTVVHDEPRLVSQEERLVVEIESLGAEGMRLRAFRQLDRVFNQDYWREGANTPGPLTSVSPGALRVSSIGLAMPEGGLSGDVFVAVALVAFFAVVIVVAWPFLLVAAVAGGSIDVLNFSTDDERTTVRRVESSRAACVSVSIESTTTGERLNLGPQPDHGWILLPETIRLLGGPGATVVIRDDSLDATVTLGSR